MVVCKGKFFSFLCFGNSLSPSQSHLDACQCRDMFVVNAGQSLDKFGWLRVTASNGNRGKVASKYVVF